MKRILILIIGLFGVAQAQFAPTSSKTKFVNGISIGSKDSTYFTNAGDTVVLYIGRDSAVYARYKGYHRKLAYYDQVDTAQIFQQVVRTFGAQTVGGKKTFSDTIVTQRGLRINNGVGNINVGEELIEASSTGLVSGGNITKSSSTTYSIAAGEGHVINNVTKRYKAVSWAASNNRTPSISNVQLHVLVDSSGNFIEQSTPPTRAQRRSFIYLGYVSQVGTTVNAATSSSQVISQPVNQSYDFFDAYGPFNVTGNTLSSNGANMRLNKTAGEMFKAGSNFQVNPNDPNVRAQSAMTPLTFKYATLTAPETNGRLDIDPTKYDVAGTATTIAGSGNQATIQRVWLFPSDTIRIQYGQTVYSSLANALTALSSGADAFTPNPRYPGNAELLGFIVVTKGATSLADLTNARVLMNVLATTGTAVAGSTYWGDILGSLNNQTDLRDTLAQRVNLTTNQTIGGAKTFSDALTVNNSIDGQTVRSTRSAAPQTPLFIGQIPTSASTDSSVLILGRSASGTYNLFDITMNQFVANQSTGSASLNIFDNGGKIRLQYWDRDGTVITRPLTINGNLTATSLIRSGGTSSQFLKADGSVDANTYATTASLGSYKLIADTFFTNGYTTRARTKQLSDSLAATKLDLTGGTLSGGLSGTSVSMTSTISGVGIVSTRSAAPQAPAFAPRIPTSAINDSSVVLLGQSASGTYNLFDFTMQQRVANQSTGSLALNIFDNGAKIRVQEWTRDSILLNRPMGATVSRVARVGINTTILGPSETFTAYNNNSSFAISAQSTTATVAAVGVYNSPTSGDNKFIDFYEGAFNLRGSITYNRGSGVVAYNTTSDYRAKRDELPISNAIEKVMQLKPKSYFMLDGTRRTNGFFAHELQSVIPQAVTGQKDAVDSLGKPIFQQVDLSQIIPILTKAVQEQQLVIEGLLNRIKLLEAKLN